MLLLTTDETRPIWYITYHYSTAWSGSMICMRTDARSMRSSLNCSSIFMYTPPWKKPMYTLYIYINRLTHYRSSERIMRGLKPSLFPCSSQGFSRIHFLHLRLKTVSWRDAYTHLRKTTKAITLFLKERGTRVRHERRDAEICPSTFTWWHFNMYSRNALWFYVILRFDSQRIVFLVTR